jgi:N utilization substance protein B
MNDRPGAADDAGARPRRDGGAANPGGRAGSRSARHRAREFAMQGVYQWLLSGEDCGVVQAHIERSPGFARADRPHFETLLAGAIRQSGGLEAAIVPHLDRELSRLSPVERSILMIACLELRDHHEIPYRVVINEAVDLAKDFGGTDGYKFVNGVLDRLAVALRPTEAGAGRR